MENRVSVYYEVLLMYSVTFHKFPNHPMAILAPS